MKLTPVEVQAWVGAISALLTLAVPMASLVKLIREQLSNDDADAVLGVLTQGWATARAENDARILELEGLLKRS